MASNSIKGITIQIEGKTSGLVNELKKADSALKTTQSALRDVNKALKFDPTNADLIAQKQQLLSKAIEETKQKLEAEKQVAEDAKRALEVGDITEEQYAKVQAEVVKTTEKLRQLEEQQKKMGSVGAEQMKAYGEKLQGVGEKVTKVGDSMTKNLTAPIVAVGTASVVAFNKVDEGMDSIASKTGATGQALEQMQDIAKDIATTIPVGFKEAGDAVGEVNTRFGVTGNRFNSKGNGDIRNEVARRRQDVRPSQQGRTRHRNQCQHIIWIIGAERLCSQRNGVECLSKCESLG